MNDDEISKAMDAHASSGGPAPKTHADYVAWLAKSPKRPVDKTSLAYWFSLIEKAGLPVPKTEILTMPLESQAIIWMAFDGLGKDEAAPVEPFYDDLRAAAERMGMPCFLRTTQTSAKHSWKRTCFVDSLKKIRQHVFEIAGFSVCADMMGLDWSTWVVREYLPIMPFGTCPDYGNMPVNREFRFFVDGSEYKCHHPYWPLEALQDGGWEPDADEATAYAELCELDDTTFANLKDIACHAGFACGGAWSVDLLETERGWFLTDMAEAHKSFHWKAARLKNEHNHSPSCFCSRDAEMDRRLHEAPTTLDHQKRRDTLRIGKRIQE